MAKKENNELEKRNQAFPNHGDGSPDSFTQTIEQGTKTF